MNLTNQKINIAIIAGQLVVGGAEQQLFLWLANLDRARYNPIVLTLHPGHDDYWEKPIKDLDIPLINIQHRKSKLNRMVDIIRVLKSFNPRLIHGWHLFVSPYAGIIAKVIECKSLGSLRDSIRIFHKNPLSAFLTLLTTNAILLNSKTAAQQLEKIKIRPNQNILTAQNSTVKHGNKYYRTKQELSDHTGVPANLHWIVSVGRLDHKKRFDLLLKVIALLKEDLLDFHFFLIGDGPERSKLEILNQDLEIAQHVSFLGEIPDAQKWLKAFDLFAFTSIDEGMPNVIMEAAAAGLPVVTWQLPFYEELLQDGKTALLVEAENIVDMKNALIQLIDSPELRTRLGQAAREHILTNFSLDRFVQKMTDVYESVLAAPTKTGRKTV